MAPRTNPNSYFARLAKDAPDELRSIQRAGGLRTQAVSGPESMQRARAARRARQVQIVDPEGILSASDLEARLLLLDKAHSQRMHAAKLRKARLGARGAK